MKKYLKVNDNIIHKVYNKNVTNNRTKDAGGIHMPPKNNNQNNSSNGHLQHGQRTDKSTVTFNINESSQDHSRIQETNVTENPPKPRGN